MTSQIKNVGREVTRAVSGGRPSVAEALRAHAPGKSGVHAHGEGERVIALESREGTRAMRRVEEGLSRSFSGGGVKLKLQYFGRLVRRVDSLEKTLMLGKTEGGRRRATEDKMAGWHH